MLDQTPDAAIAQVLDGLHEALAAGDAQGGARVL